MFKFGSMPHKVYNSYRFAITGQSTLDHVQVPYVLLYVNFFLLRVQPVQQITIKIIYKLLLSQDKKNQTIFIIY